MDKPVESLKSRSGTWMAVAVTAGLFISTLGLVSCSPSPTVYERPGLRFTAGPCGQSIEYPMVAGVAGGQVRGTPAEGVRSHEWRANDVLFVEAVLIENCARPPIEGDYSLKGNAISLSYKTVPLHAETINGQVVYREAACNCAYRLTYEITGIPRAEYRMDFSGTGKHLP